MNTLIATTVFANTTVDRSQVDQYLFSTEFRMLRYAQERQYHPLAIETLNRMEWVGLQIRHYVAGYQKTSRRTLKDVRLFLRDYPAFASGLVPAVIAVIRDKFIRNEWYELLPRLDKAVRAIEPLLATARRTL